jgi:DNA-binding MarR family transcriptional regulator
MKRGGRARPASAALGVVRVDPDFETEYPDGSATCTEAYASLARTGDALIAELDRCIESTFGVPQAVITALAVIDGAGEAITPSQISERVLVSGATTTSTLDALENNGWIQRLPNPDDRRSVFIEVTDAGRSIADQVLPGIRTIERDVLSVLSEKERRSLLDMLSRILAKAAEVAEQPPRTLDGPRVRPARLERPPEPR